MWLASKILFRKAPAIAMSTFYWNVPDRPITREHLIVGGVRCTIADARYDYLLSGRRLIDIMPAFYTDPQEIDALIRLGCADSTLQKFRARA
jgi:hypothetical protein